MMALAISGCATHECATVCFAPVNSYRPTNAEELRTRLNARMPAPVAKNDFYCHREDGQLVAWVVVADARSEKAVTRIVRDSAELRLLSVGYFSPADRNMFVRDDEGAALVSVERSN